MAKQAAEKAKAELLAQESTIVTNQEYAKTHFANVIGLLGIFSAVVFWWLPVRWLWSLFSYGLIIAAWAISYRANKAKLDRLNNRKFNFKWKLMICLTATACLTFIQYRFFNKREVPESQLVKSLSPNNESGQKPEIINSNQAFIGVENGAWFIFINSDTNYMLGFNIKNYSQSIPITVFDSQTDIEGFAISVPMDGSSKSMVLQPQETKAIRMTIFNNASDQPRFIELMKEFVKGLRAVKLRVYFTNSSGSKYCYIYHGKMANGIPTAIDEETVTESSPDYPRQKTSTMAVP